MQNAALDLRAPKRTASDDAANDTAVEQARHDAVLRDLMDAIETRATTIREQLRLFPAPPIEVQLDVDVERVTGVVRR